AASEGYKRQDSLTGVLSEKGKAFGRPVGVAIEFAGAVLVADDVGNTIWRISPVAETTYESPTQQTIRSSV
ncbi:hypothetical protein, partial [Acinetobacter baumannii]|uniref:hypothetical protein n=1 Tax=Acinetobacter baumannii TaxID=470 RepID=UPI000E08E49A